LEQIGVKSAGLIAISCCIILLLIGDHASAESSQSSALLRSSCRQLDSHLSRVRVPDQLVVTALALRAPRDVAIHQLDAKPLDPRVVENEVSRDQ
jgi:hypothetical protein